MRSSIKADKELDLYKADHKNTKLTKGERNRYRVALFDVDGVILTPERFYFEVHAEAHQMDPASFNVFFNSAEFGDVLKGKTELRDLLVKHSDLWGKNQITPQQIIDNWVVVEGAIDTDVLDYAKELKSGGIKICLATNQFQEKAAFIARNLVPEVFDEIYSSSDIGYIKPEPGFFVEVLKRLKRVDGYGDLKAEEIVFFDDKAEYISAAERFGIDSRLYTHSAQVKDFAAQLATA